MREADVVVAHAGVGTALAALEVGKCPVLVPRRLAHGEHVDDHQVQIASELGESRPRGVGRRRPLRLEDLLTAAAGSVVSAVQAPTFATCGAGVREAGAEQPLGEKLVELGGGALGVELGAGPLPGPAAPSSWRSAGSPQQAPRAASASSSAAAGRDERGLRAPSSTSSGMPAIRVLTTGHLHRHRLHQDDRHALGEARQAEDRGAP